VDEDSYRQSRLCRLLGNPVAFTVVKLLENKELNPSEIARAVGRSVQRVSTLLGLCAWPRSCVTTLMANTIGTGSNTPAKSATVSPRYPAL
jgi:hypothetical protein